MSFVRDGNVLRNKALALELSLRSEPEYNFYLDLRSIESEPESRLGRDFWRASVSWTVRESVREVLVGEGYVSNPDQRLVDYTGLTAFGAIPKLLLEALQAAVFLPDFQKDSDGATTVRLIAAGKLVNHLRAALQVEGESLVVIAEQPIERAPLTD